MSNKPIIAPSEEDMWKKVPLSTQGEHTDEKINHKYLQREWRIITETNREQLPNFVEALKRQDWMDTHPFYQRRQRWDLTKQSKLIESFIMNIPVPPLFVFESDLAKYEVMDGQQRITAIRDFYSNSFKLEGLEHWAELNGRTYSDLPSEIKKGIDRRSISYTVLLKESAETNDDQMLIRQMVFERLNTGGVDLSQQEIRNCLYHSKFNDLLFDLAKIPEFRAAWRLPEYNSFEEKEPPKTLVDNKFYSKMEDVETILRFFALRHVDHYQRGMKGFLDIYMVKARQFTYEDISILQKLFKDTIKISCEIYEKNLFCLWNSEKKTWGKTLSRAFADAVLVGFSRNLEHAEILLKHKKDIIDSTKNLFVSQNKDVFSGRGNTKSDVQNRIKFIENMLQEIVARG